MCESCNEHCDDRVFSLKVREHLGERTFPKRPMKRLDRRLIDELIARERFFRAGSFFT